MKRIFIALIMMMTIMACNKNEERYSPERKIDKEMIRKAIELRNFKNNSKLNRFFQTQMTELTSTDFAEKQNPDNNTNEGYPHTVPTWGSDTTTCAKYTFEKRNGYTIETWDYGNGCYEHGILTKGKFVTKWKENRGSYYWETLYLDYEQTYTYYDYAEGDSTASVEKKTEIQRINGYYNNLFEKKDLKFDSSGYSSIYTTEENLVCEWNNSSYTCVSKSKRKYSNGKTSILEGEFLYKSDNGGEEYRWNVIAPVVWDYEYEGAWLALSGTEHYWWKDAKGHGEFEIDYGDGTFDNLVTVTTNNETEIIDVSDFFFFNKADISENGMGSM